MANVPAKILRRLNRSMIVGKKISEKDLRKFGEKFATDKKTLIVYIEFPYEDLLPNHDIMPHYEFCTDRYYDLLANIADGSYERVVATGLLEHMSDQKQFVAECHRILAPGGTAYISASSVFSVHRGPEDYFHITKYGAQLLFKDFAWSKISIAGSCGPFRTLAIMLQRILLQCEVHFWIRPILELTAWALPAFDWFVVRQYDGRDRTPERQIESMMPSNMQIIATK
jgi:SAM-dependent methyltransferase